MAAVNAQDYDKALAKYVELVPIDSFSNNRQIILDVSRLYLMKGDTTNAIKYAEVGTQKYPEDGEMATQYIELNLMAGNDEKTINAITDQSYKNSINQNLHYYLGIDYSETAYNENEEDSYNKALENDLK